MDEYNKQDEQENNAEEGNFLEETAYEFAPGLKEYYQAEQSLRKGFIYGMLGIFFSLLALYLFPLITGLVGLFFGFQAVKLGSTVMGYTAIAFSLFSIILSVVLFL